MVSSAYWFHRRLATLPAMPWLPRNNIVSRLRRFNCQAARKFSTFLAVKPLIFALRKRSGWLSRMSAVSSPNTFTMASAVFWPIPLKSPEARYSVMLLFLGATISKPLHLNWRPYLGWLPHSPSILSVSPALKSGKVPVTTTGALSPSTFTRNTEKPLSGLWKVTLLMVPSSCIREVSIP